ncbi:MAG: AI-2E family transporter [Geminicoccaceae bacterium]|nr:MAG: AI-2E family transporter [Geminicoccaceae bacterium]
MREPTPTDFQPISTALWLLVAVAVGSVLVFGREVLVPLAVAILVWAFVNAVATLLVKLSRWVLRNRAALPPGVALVFAVLLVVWMILLIVQIVADNVAMIAQAAPGYRDSLQQAIPELGVWLGVDVPDLVGDILDQIRLSEILAQLAGALTALAGNAVLVMLYTGFLLLEQQALQRKLEVLHDDPVRAQRTRLAVARAVDRIEVYIRVKTFVSAVTAVLSYGVMWLFEINYATFWALIIFLLNYIPNIGSILAVTFPTLLTLVQFGDPYITLTVGSILAALQFTIGNIVEPRLMGSSLNLSPFVIILSLATWGSIWGIAGMFLCVPLTMILLILLSQFPQTRPIAVLLSGNGRLD